MASTATGTLLLCVLISLQCSYISSEECGDAIVPRQDDQLQSTCMVWGGLNLRTFNGNVFSYKSTCNYTLASTKISGVPFEVIFKQSPNSLLIKYKGNYVIKQSRGSTIMNKNGVHAIVLSTFKNGMVFKNPTTLGGINVSLPGSLVSVRIQEVGMTIKWDKADTAEIIVDNERKLELSGLCGRNDACKAFDMVLRTGERTDSEINFADSWSEEKCKAKTSVNTCKGGRPSLLMNAETFCTKLFADAKFKACKDESADFMNLCTSNYCSCTAKNRNDCMCEMLDSFVRTCRVNKGLDFINWRDANLCRKMCSNPDQEYMSCAPNKRQLSCGEDEVVTSVGECEEGCYCPQGLRLFKDKCLLLDECPCVYENMDYLPGATVQQERNTCTCKKRQWSCTDVSHAQSWEKCSVWGNIHVRTFSGWLYSFKSNCEYTVFEDISEERTIRVTMKSVECSTGSCIKHVKILYSAKGIEESIQFSTGAEPIITGKLSNLLMVSYDVATMVEVKGIGTKLLWVKYGWMHLHVKNDWKAKHQDGLCGSYSDLEVNDFLTPQGTGVSHLVDSWKLNKECPKEVELPTVNVIFTDNSCNTIFDDEFQACRAVIPIGESYNRCLMDANFQLLTTARVEDNCSTVSTYAQECNKLGVPVEWKKHDFCRKAFP